MVLDAMKIRYAQEKSKWESYRTNPRKLTSSSLLFSMH